MTVSPRLGLSPTPDAAPLAMPTQALDAPARKAGFAQPWNIYAARVIAFGGAAALTVYGFLQMKMAFGNEVFSGLQTALLVFFTISFGWISLSATQAVAALFAGGLRPKDDVADRRLDTKTAIIMPVYNEDPSMTCAALQAMGEAIDGLGEAAAFEIFILSDTTNPEVWVKEAACFDMLRSALSGKMPVWYRRRSKNVGRKAGNLREFTETWGGRYDHMLVLDADSLMSAQTVISLARRMQAEPKLGILQTVPVLMGGSTVFSRIQQFAGRVYGPVIARGVAAWQGRDGNYWGHNAIIRMPAFAACCGMPELPGRMPFGGHVLSHDFVEAALIRKGGYQVRMDTDLGGSWEGSPQTLLDLAARDRRWAQGNLQHGKILGARGLTWSNRAHFMIGIGSYVMSSVWLVMLIIGGLLTAQTLLFGQTYFDTERQLFPKWPIFDSVRMIWLLVLAMVMLFLPKIVGTIRAILVPEIRRSFGGARQVLAGMGTEVVLSALLAPVLMFFQVQQLIEILSGRDSGWSAQSRDAEDMAWGTAIANHASQVILGLAMFAASVVYAPNLLVWLAPVFLGLILSPVLSRFTGRVINRAPFTALSIPEDLNPPAAAQRAGALRADYQAVAAVTPLALLQDPLMAQRHIASLPHRVTPVGQGAEEVTLDMVTARAKLDHATDAESAIESLQKGEMVEFLGSPDLLLRFGNKFA